MKPPIKLKILLLFPLKFNTILQSEFVNMTAIESKTKHIETL